MGIAHEKMIEIISADAAGKVIERKRIGTVGTDGWQHVVIPIREFDFKNYEHRVKPEPKLVPFTFKDAVKMIGLPVRHETLCRVAVITYVEQHCLHLSGNTCSFDDFSKRWTFLDGSPCGKVVEE